MSCFFVSMFGWISTGSISRLKSGRFVVREKYCSVADKSADKLKRTRISLRTSSQSIVRLDVLHLGQTRNFVCAERREGPDAGHVRLPQRHLALPLLRRHLPELHRIPTGGERAPGGGALPIAEPGRGGHHLRGGLRGVAHGPHTGAQRLGPRPLHVPGLAHAQERRRLAAAQRHGPRQPPPPRLHLQVRQGGRRGHRLRVALRRREPVRDQGDGEGDVPQPRRVGRHERPLEVAGAGELLQGPPKLPGGVQGQLGAADGRAQRLPRQVRGPVGKLHRRRLLQEERSRRRGGGHGQGQRRPGLRLREHLGLQCQRHVHSPARQDSQRHLQRLIRRRGVAAAAGAAMAAARPATCSPRCSSGPVISPRFVCCTEAREQLSPH